MNSRALLARLAGMLRPQAGRLGVGFLLLVTGAGLNVVGPLLVRRAIDVDIAGRDFRGLLGTCGIFLAIQGLLVVVRVRQQLVLEGVGQAVIGDLRQRLFVNLLAAPVRYHDENPAGKLITRVEGDVEELRRLFTSTLVVGVGSVLLFAGMFAVMAAHDRFLTLVMAILVPLLTGAVIWLQLSTGPLFLAVRKKTAELTGALTEWLQGAPVLQALRQEEEASRRLRELNVDRFESQFGVERRMVLFWNAVFLVEALGIAALFGFGGWRVAQGAITVGVVVMFIDYLRRTFEPIHQIAHELRGFQQGFAAARVVFEALDERPEPAPGEPAAWTGLASEIEFQGVWFAYRGEDWVLRDVSFRMPRGSHWALVGVTGGGKSTLASLLLKFHEPTRGRILIDGIDLARLTPGQVRARIGFVPQDLYLFDGDVLENLCLGEGADEARARRAAKALDLDLFLEGLPEGYRTPVSERGLNFSAGERQLLCAARALLAGQEILIFDEATSAVDPATERRIQTALRRVREGRTTLTIAHRLATVLESDRILVLDRGELVEAGRHEDLLAADGFYARLSRLQFEGAA